MMRERETTMADRFDQAMELAREYRRHIAHNNVVNAEQTRRSIDDCGIGSYVNGRWTLAPAIRREMGLDPDLVVLDTGELALVTLRRAPGAIAPHGARRWSERLGRLLREEGIGEGRFRGAPDPADPRVVALKGAMGR